MKQFAGKKILVLAQEPELCTTLVAYLESLGYLSLSYNSLEQFEQKLQEFNPHFLILDLFIEKNEVYTAISTVRESENFRTLPILVTGSGELHEKINALSVGADDILLHPIDLEVLRVKIQALFRRSMSYQTSIHDIYYKNLKLSPLSGEVFIGEDRVDFTETEFKLLETLVTEKGRAVRRESLANRSLTAKNKNMRTIDVHINAIRGKLGSMGTKIKTLRGKGYMLID